MSSTTRTTATTRVLGAAALLAGTTLAAFAAPAVADPSEGQPEKVFVCKYVGTPDVDERLQTGNNPIEVSVNAIPIYTGQPAIDLVGQEFADAQGRSIVIAVSPVRGGGQGDEPTIEDCPAPAGPPETPETETPTPETPTTVTPTPETPTTVTPTPETVTPPAPEVLPETATQTPQSSPDVLGEQATAPNTAPITAPNQQQSPTQVQQQPAQAQSPSQPQQALPTAVDAGVSGPGAPAGTEAFLAMLLVMLGVVSARLGWIRARG